MYPSLIRGTSVCVCTHTHRYTHTHMCVPAQDTRCMPMCLTEGPRLTHPSFFQAQWGASVTLAPPGRTAQAPRCVLQVLCWWVSPGPELTDRVLSCLPFPGQWASLQARPVDFFSVVPAFLALSLGYSGCPDVWLDHHLLLSALGELNYLKLGTLATRPAWQAWMCDWVVQCTDAAFCVFSCGKCFILSWKLQDSALKGTVASWAGGEKPPHPPILLLSGFHLVWAVFPLQISVSSFVKAARG